MKIGVLSDTHDHIEHAKKAKAVFLEHKVERVIHCGDFCSPFMMQHFKDLSMHAVFGNNDGDLFLLQKKAKEFGITLHGGFAEFIWASRSIAVYHGTYEGITQALVQCGLYDVVLTGHTHEFVSKKVGKTLHLNPGSAHGFAKKPQLLVLDLADLAFEQIDLAQN